MITRAFEKLEAKINEQRAEIERLRRSEAFHVEACAAHQRHIDELQAIVDRLPKTADGVPVAFRQELWYAIDCEPKRLWHDRGDWNSYWDIVESCYSTREAADAARAEAGEG